MVTKMVPKIKITYFLGGDETNDWRDYHTTVSISRSPCQDFKWPLRPKSEQYLNATGKIGASLIEEIFSFLGIKEAFIEPFKLSVIKGEAFEWGYLQPRVLEALKKAFGDEAGQVEIVYPKGTPKSEKTPRKGLVQRIRKTIRSLWE